ncbi:hypothetical protein J6590_040734 [Homalodisca vitripennis]|nr:hypothetical protein J6590_040734 [Homalodisca vitripennis]
MWILNREYVDCFGRRFQCHHPIGHCKRFLTYEMLEYGDRLTGNSTPHRPLFTCTNTPRNERNNRCRRHPPVPSIRDQLTPDLAPEVTKQTQRSNSDVVASATTYTNHENR